VAETAEALMRSRYAAFALDLSDYLMATWHPRTRPATIELDTALEWVRLEVLDTTGGGRGDSEGEVEFTAHHREDGSSGLLHERSRFVRRGGRWFYLDGRRRLTSTARPAGASTGCRGTVPWQRCHG
jgi:SEC-C motif-containing protein